jgi:arginine:ornithine antiporter / lysine permease
MTTQHAIFGSITSQRTLKVGTTPHKLRLSLSLLIALVVGSMIGSGIFALPQNMAAGAGAGAILISWLISGVGMLMLVLAYQTLSVRHPELNNGVYAYARASGGEFVGFNSAWGYWVSAWIGNVGYLVIVFSTLGNFFPIFGEGNTTAAIMGATILLWTMHFMILRGIHGAAVLNALITFAKVIPLVVFLIIAALMFKVDFFRSDFWGSPTVGSVLDQVKSTMLVTVWVFIGIEGANVYSARALHRNDIGKATLIGFFITLVLLMGVSLLSLGIVPQAELAALKNPSMASILEKTVGAWGAALISVGLLISVGGALLAWTLLAAETLFSPASEHVMPRFFAQQNSAGVPANALWVTNGLVQVFLLLALFAKASYLALISLSTSMILVPYLFSAIYAVVSARGERKNLDEFTDYTKDLLVGLLAVVYCGWLLYAAGLKYLLLSSLLYVPGVVLYVVAKRERPDAERGLTAMFKPFEWVVLVVVLALSCFAAFSLWTGQLTL